MDGYMTGFHRRDGKPREDYYYHTEEEALSHLSLFENDDSGLYDLIEAVDLKNGKQIKVILFNSADCGKQDAINRRSL